MSEPEIEVEADVEDSDYVKDTWVSDLEAVFFDPLRIIGGHEVFAAAMVAGDLFLGLTSDMKLHKVEMVKGMPSGASIRAIAGKKET